MDVLITSAQTVRRRIPLRLFAFVAVMPLAIAHAQQYTIRELAPNSGYDSSGTLGISEQGAAAGEFYVNNTLTQQAAMWNSAGTATALGILPGGTWSQGIAMNNTLVVGASNVSASSTFLTHAFLWSSALGMTDLGTINAGESSAANDINNQNLIVGQSGNQAFLYQSSTKMKGLGFLPGGASSFATSINDNGVVVGTSDSTDGTRGFIWTQAGGMQSLGVLAGGEISGATAINASGTVVGYSYAGGLNRPFIWTSSGGMVGLTNPFGGSAAANWINDSNQVVGVINGPTSQLPFFWTQAGGMKDLNTMLAPGSSGWSLMRATGINNAGQITGLGTHNGLNRAFVLTPVPEPASLAAMSLGGLGLLRRARVKRGAKK